MTDLDVLSHFAITCQGIRDRDEGDLKIEGINPSNSSARLIIHPAED
jgi:hypothetical protein